MYLHPSIVRALAQDRQNRLLAEAQSRRARAAARRDYRVAIRPRPHRWRREPSVAKAPN